MKGVRVLHISGNIYPVLPSEHHTKRIWGELAKGADEYHVFARGRGWRCSNSSEGNIHLHLVPSIVRSSSIFLLTSWLLPLLVLRVRPTVLLTQCPVLGGLAASACSRLFRVPLFVELHGTHYFAPQRPGLLAAAEFLFYRTLSGASFRAAQKIRSLSREMTDALCRTYGELLRKKVVAIPTRVDLQVFSSIKRHYTVNGSVRLVTVGAVTALKNHVALIRDLVGTGMPFHLTIVGRGPMESLCAAEALRLGVAGSVTLAGPMTHAQLASLLPNYDAYIHYSLAEGLSRAILEAMAAGLPVISAPVGFIGGVLRHSQNAIVLAEHSVQALSEALVPLAQSEERRRRLGTAARATIEENFSADLVFAIYRDALASLSPAVMQ